MIQNGSVKAQGRKNLIHIIKLGDKTKMEGGAKRKGQYFEWREKKTKVESACRIVKAQEKMRWGAVEKHLKEWAGPT